MDDGRRAEKWTTVSASIGHRKVVSVPKLPGPTSADKSHEGRTQLAAQRAMGRCKMTPVNGSVTV
jgi:hypothetical protein